MDDGKVLGLPKVQNLEPRLSRSQDSDAKWFITNIIIESNLDKPDHLKVTFSSEEGKAEVLLLEKMSPQRWKYDGTIALTNEVTFMAQWDETDNFGTVHLVKTELEEMKENGESYSQIVQEFVTEEEGPQLRLVFELDIVPPDENIVFLGDEDMSKSFIEYLSENPDSAWASVLKIPDEMPEKPQLLNLIGDIFLARFDSTVNIDDLNNSIQAYDLAVQLLPVDDANFLDFLDDSGVTVHRRYDLTGSLEDLNLAISKFETGVQITPAGHPYMPGWLTNIGLLLQSRFEHTDDLMDSRKAISFHQKAIQLTSENHKNMPARLNYLGNSFQSRFDRTGDVADISEAISSRRKAIQFTPEDDEDMPGWLGNLGISLQSRFDRTGDITDISESILCKQKAIELTPEGDGDMPGRLSSLGNSLRSRFQRTGDLADISEAISSQQKAIQLTPDGNSNMPSWLTNLGHSLHSRFKNTGDLADLSEAISLTRKAVQLTPDGHKNMSGHLSNLATLFRSGSQSSGILTEAVTFQQDAIRLTPEDHPNMPGWLGNLGGLLQTRFEHSNDLTDITQSISLLQKAIQLSPEDDVNRPGWLSEFGNALKSRFDRTRDFADITEAISSLQKAIQLTPEGHANLPGLLNNLGNSLQSYFERTGDQAILQQGISNYRRSATYPLGSPSIRLDAAKQWYNLSLRLDSSDPSQLLEPCHTVIRLISLAAGLEQTIRMRYTNLVDISELSATAAATAFQFGEHRLALEWLEQGRCLVWSQLNDLRTPLHDLRIHNPALADDVLRVSMALENAGSRSERLSMKDEATAHIKLAQEWDQLLIKVRDIPQFEDFLKPVSCASLLKHIPDSGPVVVINIHEDRSDALALVSGVEEPLHIPLHEFSYKKADDLRNLLKAHLLESGVRMRGSKPDTRGMRYKTSSDVIKDILLQLWTGVVKPIIDGIHFSKPLFTIRRIWWCVTGPLAFLPIHAAGMYSPTSSTWGIYCTLPDFVVSSYTPTVRALVERVQSPREITDKKMGLFMISQPDAPTLPRIPGTTNEVRAIERLLKSHNLRHLCLEGDAATVNPVLTNMDAYSCIHFACHAAQNTDEPLQSGFYLRDGQIELLSIIRKRLEGADLAFLSACQTCAGDEQLSEEAVHLAAGMLAAGYRSVVATMWSIQDSYGPTIAQDFYESLISKGADVKKGSEALSGDHGACALHYATQQIRKTLGDSESSLLTWVPYVHFGL